MWLGEHEGARERHALALEARALRNEVGGEPATRVDDPVAWHGRVIAVVQGEAGETRRARVTRDHRHHAVRRDATTRDPLHDFVYALVPLAAH